MLQTSWTKTRTQNQPGLLPWPLANAAAGAPMDAYRLDSLTRRFTPITLQEMDAVMLLDRTDTKFVLSTAQLLQALAAVQHDYRMLAVQGIRLNRYRTLYFDTADFALYHLHVNDRAERYKVRSREYTDSGLSFLEVKHKTRKDRTVKDRMPTARQVTQLSTAAAGWLAQIFPYDTGALEPKLWNTFTRVTLVSRERCERVTLDVDLAFHTETQRRSLPGVAVAEVKTDSAGQPSPFMAQMHAQHIRPMGFSKYCIGVSLLYQQVKKNSLKPTLLQVEKLVEGMH
jgi:hypothetical protein